MTESASIWGQQWRLRHCGGGPEELATTKEASAEQDVTKVLTMTTEVSAEEAEETTHPSDYLRRQRRRCVYGIRVLTTTTVEVVE